MYLRAITSDPMWIVDRVHHSPCGVQPGHMLTRMLYEPREHRHAGWNACYLKALEVLISNEQEQNITILWLQRQIKLPHKESFHIAKPKEIWRNIEYKQKKQSLICAMLSLSVLLY